MSECFWTGFINCAEPSCGGDTPEPPPVGVQHIAIYTGDPPAFLETIEGIRYFDGYEIAWPGLGIAFDCANTRGPNDGPVSPTSMFSLGYDEVRVGGIWYSTADFIPTPGGFAEQSPCVDTPPGDEFLYQLLGPFTVRFRGGALPEVELPAYIVSNTGS